MIAIIANTYRRNQFLGTHSHQRTLRHVSNIQAHYTILPAANAWRNRLIPRIDTEARNEVVPHGSPVSPPCTCGNS